MEVAKFIGYFFKNKFLSFEASILIIKLLWFCDNVFNFIFLKFTIKDFILRFSYIDFSFKLNFETF